MDNLGDWLYIVFLIVAAVSGIFSSGKKKKQTTVKPVQPQQQGRTDSNTSEGKGFWEILEDMQNGPQEVQKPHTKNMSSPKKAPQKAAPSPFLTAEKNIPGVTQKQTTPILEEDDYIVNHAISQEDFHLQDVDEVRKAIIYSEILQRRY